MIANCRYDVTVRIEVLTSRRRWRILASGNLVISGFCCIYINTGISIITQFVTRFMYSKRCSQLVRFVYVAIFQYDG